MPTAARWCPARCFQFRANSTCPTATISVHTTNNEALGLYIGDVVTSRATNQRGQPRFFALSRKRAGMDGRFGGVVVISISPDYFREYYATLTQPIIAALIRADGVVLARYPELPRETTRLTQGFVQAARAASRRGNLHGQVGHRRQGAPLRVPQAAARRPLRGDRPRHGPRSPKPGWSAWRAI